MKHQYFGDRHDFYNYDRLLYPVGAGLGLEHLVVDWMPTPNEGLSDGAPTSCAAKNRDAPLPIAEPSGKKDCPRVLGLASLI